MTRLTCHTSTTKKGYYCHVAKNETCVSRRSIMISGKHAKSVFFLNMSIEIVFHVILYIKIYFAQTRLCIDIVVNRRCDVSNAISSEISMDRKLAWVENCTGNYNSFVNFDRFEKVNVHF